MDSGPFLLTLRGPRDCRDPELDLLRNILERQYKIFRYIDLNPCYDFKNGGEINWVTAHALRCKNELVA